MSNNDDFKKSFFASLNFINEIIDSNTYRNYHLILIYLKYISEKFQQNENYFIKIPKDYNFNSLIGIRNSPDIRSEIDKCFDEIANANPLLDDVLRYVNFNKTKVLDSIESETLNTLISHILLMINELNKEDETNTSFDCGEIVELFEEFEQLFSEYHSKIQPVISTPIEVAELISKLILSDQNVEINNIYDPTTGSGNLLLALSKYVDNNVEIFGQDINSDQVFLTKLNLLIHDEYNFKIERGDVLKNPRFLESNNSIKKFDCIVANFPFNLKMWGNQEYDIYNRWNTETGIPPSNNGDYAFILHAVNSLKSNGIGACVVSSGVLLRDGSEKKIRKYLIEKGHIKGIISLPAKLFNVTSIPTSIIIIENNPDKVRNGIFVIDASAEFEADRFQNKLTLDGITRITDVWLKNVEVNDFSKFVTYDEIRENDYNLNIGRYLANLEELHVPEDSKLIKLSDFLVSVQRIKSDNTYGKIVKISDLSENPFLYNISIETLSEGEVNKNLYRLSNSAVLISKRFNKLKASFCNASAENPVYISTDIEAFTMTNDNIDLSYLILQLSSDFVLKQVESLSFGSALPSLSRQDILRLKIIVPNTNSQVSLARQKALTEGARIQSDKSKIESLQLQNTIDTLLKERMNDFQWTLHDLRNGDLLSIKNKVSILQKISLSDKRFNEIIVDVNNNVTLGTFIEKLALNVNNLSNVLTSMFDDSDNFGSKEKLNLTNMLSDFILNQSIIDKELFSFNDYDFNELNNLLEKNQNLFIEFNKKDFLKICTNIFENIIRHSGFLNGDKKLKNIIKISIELDKKNQEVSFSFLNTGSENVISESDYFSNGGRKGETSNSGKGGFIIKELAVRNSARPFQKSFAKKNPTDFVFEVGLTIKYFLDEI